MELRLPFVWTRTRFFSDVALFAGTAFSGAFLLFALEPMVGKIVLPILGGTPAVWNTCLVFYQTIYLAGCLWVWALQRVGGRAQLALQAGLFVLALLALPPLRLATVADAVPTEANPIPWLLGNLLRYVGLPLLVLSTTSPLVQSWYARGGFARSKDPYFLSMASNAGSLGALLAYPFWLEAQFSLSEQSRLWSLGLCVLGALAAVCAAQVRWAKTVTAHSDVPAVPARRRIEWMVLSLLPSSLLAGSTAYLGEVISAIPLLWVLPLALYLITLIAAFWPAVERYRGTVLAAALLVFPVWAGALWAGTEISLWVLVPVHLGAFFLTALAAHASLAAARPRAAALPEFYIWMAVGGAVGGALNSLLAPVIFSRTIEYPLVVLVTGLVLARLAAVRVYTSRLVRVGLSTVAAGAAAVLLAAIARAEREAHVLDSERNFFGVVRVMEDPGRSMHLLLHHSQVEGSQFLDPARASRESGHYSADAPIGEFLRALTARNARARVGVIGLGAGVLASYAPPASGWDFFEINPAVIRFAQDPRLFRYLSDRADGQWHVRAGDARRQLMRVSDRSYEAIVVDAFQSSAMPVHLMTRESLALYRAKLKPGGVIAYNVNSRIFRLQRVLCRLASDAGLTCFGRPNPGAERAPDDERFGWLFLARAREDLGKLAADPAWISVAGDDADPVWTDDYSNPQGLIRRPRTGRLVARIRRAVFGADSATR